MTRGCNEKPNGKPGRTWIQCRKLFVANIIECFGRAAARWASNLKRGLAVDQTAQRYPKGDATVHCSQCQAILNSLPGAYEGRVRSIRLPEQLTALLCSRCGAVLPSPDFDHGLLAKLTQLSRFGLGADDRPLLMPEQQAH